MLRATPVMSYRTGGNSRMLSRRKWRRLGAREGYQPCCVRAYARGAARSHIGPGVQWAAWWLLRHGVDPRVARVDDLRAFLSTPAIHCVPCGACRKRLAARLHRCSLPGGAVRLHLDDPIHSTASAARGRRRWIHGAWAGC